jgi:hypothetical protein
VSNAEQPIWAGGLRDLWYGVGAAGVDTLAFVVAAGAGFRTIDASDPGSPREISALFPVADLTDVAYSRGYAYATSALVGRLLVYDLSDPSNPLEEGAYSNSGKGAYSVAVDGDYAYVAWNDELTVLDISNPSSPTLVGTYEGLDAQEPQVVASHPYAFVADRTPGSQGVLYIIDVSAPSSPSRVGFMRFASVVSGVAVSGSYAYVVGGRRD